MAKTPNLVQSKQNSININFAVLAEATSVKLIPGCIVKVTCGGPADRQCIEIACQHETSWAHRSEGVAEQDIGSLGVMGWGLMLAESSSAAAVVVAAVTGHPGGVLYILMNNLIF